MKVIKIVDGGFKDFAFSEADVMKTFASWISEKLSLHAKGCYDKHFVVRFFLLKFIAKGKSSVQYADIFLR